MMYSLFIQDYKKELRRIADFLGFPVSEDLLQQIAEKLNIKTVLKDLNEVMKDPDIQAYAKEVSKDGILPFYRKGKSCLLNCSLFKYSRLSYLDFAYLEKPLISMWKSGPCLNIKI